MQTDASSKQLVVERIKNATSILVTVSHDPSVDELSAALALTLVLNKLDKHATAVFSGKIPPAISFLQPDKTFENSVDSLRDFIIALDKEKADRLRYKVENDVVRIFITPYRSVITQKDLQFSQGDFNVELVLTLGVEKREDLDTAITSHGRILHDAPVVTINNKDEKSSLGEVDWSDGSASSLCEMLMSLSEALQSNLLDEQISTALLTGIVAATERFRNTRTSPKVMTMAAQLMAAGANQQLIAAKLEEGKGLSSTQASDAPDGKNPDGSKKLRENKSEKLKKADQPETKPADSPKPDGEMTIDHEATSDIAAPEPMVSLPAPAPSPAKSPATGDGRSEEAAEAKLDNVVKAQTPTLSVDDLKKDIAAANDELNAAAAADSPIGDVKGDWRDKAITEPSFGGTLNATTEEAEQDKLREEMSPRNHTLLSHDDKNTGQPSANDRTAEASPPSQQFASNPPVTPLSPATSAATNAPLQYEETPASEEPTKTLSDLEASINAAPMANTLDDARAAVDAALSALPFDPANQPLEGVGARPLDQELGHSDEAVTQPQTLAPPAGAENPVETPSEQATANPSMPVLPPLPDFSTLPPLPSESNDSPANSPHPAVEPTAPAPDLSPPASDPGQFKLPGQS